MTYHNQRSLVGCNDCRDVWCRDPATFRRYYGVTCCISNMPSSYKPLDFCRWVAVSSCTCEGYWITYPSFRWTWDANLSWSNCVRGARKTFLINIRFPIWYYLNNHSTNTVHVSKVYSKWRTQALSHMFLSVYITNWFSFPFSVVTNLLLAQPTNSRSTTMKNSFYCCVIFVSISRYMALEYFQPTCLSYRKTGRSFMISPCCVSVCMCVS